MPKGIPKKGYRRTQKLDAPSINEIERRLVQRVPELVTELQELTKTHYCPRCQTPIITGDREAIIYLIDRAMGKPKQTQTLDITQTIMLNADQIDSVIRNHLPQIVEMFRPEIVALLPEGITEGITNE